MIFPIKKKWLDMIRSGEKREEYREIKPYYTSRLNSLFGWRWMSVITGTLINTEDGEEPPRIWVRFRNGYGDRAPSVAALISVRVGTGREEWGAEPGKKYYILDIHEIHK